MHQEGIVPKKWQHRYPELGWFFRVAKWFFDHIVKGISQAVRLHDPCEMAAQAR